MRHTWIFLMSLLGAGCATQSPIATPTALPASPPSVVVPAAMPTKVVETRYEVRSYRDPADPSVLHEAHAVYRRTRVPATASDECATVPRESFPPASYAPLPASEELAVELASQRAITSDIRGIQASIAETEREMQAQYAQLVRQGVEVMKTREQLEAERRRVAAPPPEPDAAAPAGAKAENTDVKW